MVLDGVGSLVRPGARTGGDRRARGGAVRAGRLVGPTLVAAAGLCAACDRDVDRLADASVVVPPPELVALPATLDAREGAVARLVVTARDPLTGEDGAPTAPPCLFADLGPFERSAAFEDLGDGRARFTFVPDYRAEAADATGRPLRVVACRRDTCDGLVAGAALDEATAGGCVGAARVAGAVDVRVVHPFAEPAPGDVRAPRVLTPGPIRPAALGEPRGSFFGLSVLVHAERTAEQIVADLDLATPGSARLFVAVPGQLRVAEYALEPFCRKRDGELCPTGQVCPDSGCPGGGACTLKCTMYDGGFHYGVRGPVRSVVAPLAGLAEGYVFGTQLAGLRDVTGDGLGDLLVVGGRPSADVDGSGQEGVCGEEVVVYAGQRDGDFAARPAARLRDPAGSSGPCLRFGASLAAGDVDGDGVADVVVGAPGRTGALGLPGPQCAPGRVLVFRGGATLGDAAPFVLDPTPTDTDGERFCMRASVDGWSHDHPEGGFGSAVAVIELVPAEGAATPGLLVVGASMAVGPFPELGGSRQLVGGAYAFRWNAEARALEYRYALPDDEPALFGTYGSALAWATDPVAAFLEATPRAVLAVGAPGARLASGKVVVFVVDRRTGELVVDPRDPTQPRRAVLTAPTPERGALFGLTLRVYLGPGTSFLPRPALVVGAPLQSALAPGGGDAGTGASGTALDGVRLRNVGAAYVFTDVSAGSLGPLVQEIGPVEPIENGLFGLALGAHVDGPVVAAPYATVATHPGEGLVTVHPPGF